MTANLEYIWIYDKSIRLMGIASRTAGSSDDAELCRDDKPAVPLIALAAEVESAVKCVEAPDADDDMPFPPPETQTPFLSGLHATLRIFAHFDLISLGEETADVLGVVNRVISERNEMYGYNE